MLNYNIESVPATHYTGALAQYAAEGEEFPGLAGDGSGIISGISIKSREQLDWQVEVWDSYDNILMSKSFEATNANQQSISDVLYYFYPVADVEFPIPMTKPKGTVTIALRNLSSDSKTAGTNGAVTIFLNIMK